MTHSLVLLIAVAAPWLSPFSLGPTPVIVQCVVTALCASWIALMSSVGRQQIITNEEINKNWLPHGWLVAASLSALIGLAQYFGVADIFGMWASKSSIGEAYGNLRQRNQFATLLNMGLASTLWCGALVGQKKGSTFKSLLPMLITAAMVGAANAAAASRTGLLQLFLLALLGTWHDRHTPERGRSPIRLTVLVALLAYLLASISFPLLLGMDPQNSGIFGRFHEGGGACQSRLILWSNVLHLITQKPWLGWGWGELAYAHFITLYPGDRFCDILDNAHNLPLHVAVTLGIPVAVTFCTLCILLIVREKPWKEQDPLRQLAWTVLVLIGFHSLLEYPLWYGPFQMTVLSCIYILWRKPPTWLDVSGQGISTPIISQKVSPALVVVGSLVMAGCAYAAWDYWRISQIYTHPTQRALAYRDDTLKKIQDSWLFRNQVRFAELNVTPLTKDNAEHINALAKEMLHFSPEPAVVKKLIESSTMLGRDEEAAFYLQRFKAAFPNSKI